MNLKHKFVTPEEAAKRSIEGQTKARTKLNPCPDCGARCVYPKHTEDGHDGWPTVACSYNCGHSVSAKTRKLAKEKHNSIKPPCVWRQEFPDEQAYWWWVAAEEAGPVIIGIFWSGTDNSYFAHQGQLGWKEFRPREWFEKNYPDSLWMKVDLPAHPNCGGEIQVKEATNAD